jgi:mRNA-degrading endonuclease YafQ of YafQ-DinJ toxin-antitoxin module
MPPREVHAPKGGYKGKHKIYSTVKRAWDKLCQARPGPMRTCYIEIADNPFPPGHQRRHHQLKGNLKGIWQYEVGGGERVWYKPGPDGQPIVTYAGSAPPATH